MCNITHKLVIIYTQGESVHHYVLHSFVVLIYFHFICQTLLHCIRKTVIQREQIRTFHLKHKRKEKKMHLNERIELLSVYRVSFCDFQYTSVSLSGIKYDEEVFKI